jgi:hypothetical protein
MTSKRTKKKINSIIMHKICILVLMVVVKIMIITLIFPIFVIFQHNIYQHHSTISPIYSILTYGTNIFYFIPKGLYVHCAK